MIIAYREDKRGAISSRISPCGATPGLSVGGEQYHCSGSTSPHKLDFELRSDLDKAPCARGKHLRLIYAKPKT